MKLIIFLFIFSISSIATAQDMESLCLDILANSKSGYAHNHIQKGKEFDYGYLNILTKEKGLVSFFYFCSKKDSVQVVIQAHNPNEDDYQLSPINKITVLFVFNLNHSIEYIAEFDFLDLQRISFLNCEASKIYFYSTYFDCEPLNQQSLVTIANLTKFKLKDNNAFSSSLPKSTESFIRDIENTLQSLKH